MGGGKRHFSSPFSSSSSWGRFYAGFRALPLVVEVAVAAAGGGGGTPTWWENVCMLSSPGSFFLNIQFKSSCQSKFKMSTLLYTK